MPSPNEALVSQLSDAKSVAEAVDNVGTLIRQAIQSDLGYDPATLEDGLSAGDAARFLRPETLKLLDRLVHRQILLLPIHEAHIAISKRRKLDGQEPTVQLDSAIESLQASWNEPTEVPAERPARESHLETQLAGETYWRVRPQLDISW